MFLVIKKCIYCKNYMDSDFVTNSYGESWDLFSEKLWVPPSPFITNESQLKKKKGVLN